MIRTTSDFIDAIASMQFENVFNPYSEKCPIWDTDHSAAVRRNNLLIVLDSALNCKGISVWMGRDLGYRGGRRTGLALTDEPHLANHAIMMGVNNLRVATNGAIIAERTASVIWSMLSSLKRPVFLWNVFPFHPFRAGEPMSNRSHTRSEAMECRFLIDWLVEKLEPDMIVAIGRDAQLALSSVDINSVSVRHPSYGGQTEFLSGIRKLYELPEPQQGDSNSQLNFPI